MPGLAACLDTFTVPHAWYTADSYNAAQPSIEERAAWIKAVQRMLDVSDGLDAGAEPNARLGPCNAIHLPSALSSTYAVGTAHGHCVLYEIQAPCGVYARGWGWMAVPALAGESEKWWTTNTNSKLLQSKTSQRRKKLHISAPHPGYDLGTPEQAAGVYAASGARSLLVAGRKRTSYLTESTCVRAPAMSTSDEESSKTPDWGRGKEAYWMTDPAHNDQTLQPHPHSTRLLTPPLGWRVHYAMSSPSPSSPMSGPPSGSDSHTLSKEQLCALHSNKAQPQGKHGLVRMPQFRHTQRRGAISLPTTSTCALTASRNVVGRVQESVSDRGQRQENGSVMYKEQHGQIYVFENVTISPSTIFDSWSSLACMSRDTSTRNIHTSNTSSTALPTSLVKFPTCRSRRMPLLVWNSAPRRLQTGKAIGRLLWSCRARSSTPTLPLPCSGFSI